MLRIISVVRGSLRMREGSIGSVGEEDSSEEAWRRPRRRPGLAGWTGVGLEDSLAGAASAAVSALDSLGGRVAGGKYSCAAVNEVSGVVLGGLE